MEEKVEKTSSTEAEKVNDEAAKLSSSIKNAHASGDGSIKRSDEAIDSTKEDASDQRQESNTY